MNHTFDPRFGYVDFKVSGNTIQVFKEDSGKFSVELHDLNFKKKAEILNSEYEKYGKINEVSTFPGSQLVATSGQEKNFNVFRLDKDRF